MREDVLRNESLHFTMFRFSRSEVLQLMSCLGIPISLKASNGRYFSGQACLYALLGKLAHKSTSELLMPALGFTHAPHISLAYLALLRHLNPVIEKACDLQNYVPYLLKSAKDFEHRGLMAGCYCLMDGKIFQQAKQGERSRQRFFVSGHKYVQGATYLSLVLCNGMFCGFYGPVIGSRNDSFLFQKTGMYDKLTQAKEAAAAHFEGVEGGESFARDMHVLADCAFRASAHVMPVLRGGRTNPALAAVNSLLTHSRVGVEQGFGSLVSQFKYIQGDQLQLKKMPTTNIQKACILFYNLKCCIHGSNTTEWSTPPSLEDYSQTVLGMNP